MEKNIHYQCFINMDDFLKTSAHLYMSMNKEHGSFIALKLRTMQYKGYLQFLAEWNEIPHSNKNRITNTRIQGRQPIPIYPAVTHFLRSAYTLYLME